ncbi:Ff.00g040500.m01.CDS01 [Fusarium sp. VM40]|nr:Ff.00g040500.m01.CDS01 [Fusarium sp. VM40]
MGRLGHTKSRNGCSRCKQRKIKCDERRPCGLCSKRGFSCSLLLSPSLDSTSSNGHVSPNAISLIGIEGVRLLDFSKGTSIVPKCQQPSDWTEDLGLMSHYSSITSATLPGANRHVWQIEIPKVGVAHPFLMHQILAVSAFHLASLNPSECQENLSRAFKHQHHAICGIRGEVATVTPRNCHALFAGSSLLFIGAFAACARTSGGDLEQKVNDLFSAFTLIRGVSSILTSFKDVVRNGIFGGFMECNSYAKGTGLLLSLVERLGFITQSLDAGKVDHVVKSQAGEAIFALGESVGRASTASPELNVAIIWPMIIKDGFLQLIRERHPAALVVVAHYCTVLHAVGSEFWFLENWGHDLLDAIVDGLPPCWHEAVAWPLEYVKHGRTTPT